MMVNSGVLIENWPFVPGCDAAGVVVKVGEQAASKFKVGDEVCGCTRLGIKGYSTCQEFVSLRVIYPLTLQPNLTPCSSSWTWIWPS
jgi:NADPH:quinone reductase-like Zn-dependent oxidoreductase